MALLLPRSTPGAVVIAMEAKVFFSNYFFLSSYFLEMFLYKNCTIFIAGDIHYHPVCWGNPTDGYQFYEPELGVNVVRASKEVCFNFTNKFSPLFLFTKLKFDHWRNLEIRKILSFFLGLLREGVGQELHGRASAWVAFCNCQGRSLQCNWLLNSKTSEIL